MAQNSPARLISRKNVIEFNCFNKIFANPRGIIEFNNGKNETLLQPSRDEWPA